MESNHNRNGAIREGSNRLLAQPDSPSVVWSLSTESNRVPDVTKVRIIPKCFRGVVW